MLAIWRNGDVDSGVSCTHSFTGAMVTGAQEREKENLPWALLQCFAQGRGRARARNVCIAACSWSARWRASGLHLELPKDRTLQASGAFQYRGQVIIVGVGRSGDAPTIPFYHCTPFFYRSPKPTDRAEKIAWRARLITRPY